MKRLISAVAALMLAVAMATTGAFAYDYPDPVTPGDTIGISKSEFFQPRTGYSIPGDVTLNTTNFSVYKKTISKGANLVKEIKINNRTQEVDIVFAGSAIAEPSSPNVVISQLSVRAKRTIYDSYRDPLVTSNSVYEFDGNLRFKVGLFSDDEAMVRDGFELNLIDGDRKYIRWVKGDGYGQVRVSYGNSAYAEGRVFENDKVLYSCNETVDPDLEDANPGAFITSIDMGGGSFPEIMSVQLLANKGDYIYEYVNGNLKAATGLKWSEDDYAWIGKITTGKHYVFSDVRLRSVSGSTTGSTTTDTSSSSSNDYSGEYYGNPETGGGSNVAVAISAIVAVLSIAVVSIIMSTILAIKRKD